MTEQIYEFGKRFLEHSEGLHWPEERLQVQYTGTSGDRLLKQAADFLGLLQTISGIREDAPWRGLDYGVGWGRMATLMTCLGEPRQLDCVDAWEKSLDIARSCGLQNSLRLLSAEIRSGELPVATYDFAYAYSIFTHLPATHVINNSRKIVASLKPGGVFLFTVRQPGFEDFLKKNNKYRPEVDELSSSGYWFGNAQSKDYGDTILSRGWLERNLGGLGSLEVIGPMKYESTQTAVAIRKSF